MSPAVTVVIPCFNLGAYVDEAVQSVLDQTYGDAEIVIVDDGSDDEVTRLLLASYRRPRTRVIRTANAGVAHARNVGLESARGRYVSFLDADDVLERRFLERTVAALERDEAVAFASCWLTAFGEREFLWQPERCDLPWLLAEDTVCTAALTRREALVAVGGVAEDPVLDGIEDWDLAISLVEDGFAGTIVPERLFRYRLRPGSKWAIRGQPDNYARAFAAIVDRHAASYAAHGDAVLEAIGRRLDELERSLDGGAPPRPPIDARDARAAIVALETHRHRLEATAAEPAPTAASPQPVDWGSLRRLQPVSRVWGLDRGTPVDRHYIERFLQAHAAAITGDVLEVKDPGYTTRFSTGARSVTVLDVAAENPDATLVADLSAAQALPEGRFDCIVLTQTIHLIFDLERVVRNVHRALAPGGVVLATLPCVSRVDYESGVDGDCWRFTAASARRLFEQAFPADRVHVESFGNVLTCTAFLQGLATADLSADELDRADPYFPLLIGVRADRPPGPGVARPPAAIESRLDEVTCAAVSGWAWNRAAPHQRLQLEVWAGERRLGSVWSTAFRPDLEAAGKGNGRVAFSFVAPRRLHGRAADAVRVVPVGAQEAIPGSPQAAPCVCSRPGAPSGLAGSAIDQPADGAAPAFPWLDIAGWALGAHGPVERVELVDAGRVVRRVAVDGERPDLAAAFPAVGWAGRAGFATRVNLVAAAGGVDLEVVAVLADGERATIGRVVRQGRDAPDLPVLAAIAADEARADDHAALLSQATPVTRVLARGARTPPGHPGFAAAVSWNDALDEAAAIVWLCDGREDVDADFVAQGVAALRAHPEASFAAAAPPDGAPHDLAGVLSGAALGAGLLFRASAAHVVGGVDETSPSLIAAQWDLAVRLADAGHRWVRFGGARPEAATLADAIGEEGARWLYRKHRPLYDRDLQRVLLDREAVVERLLRDNHLRERRREELQLVGRARRRERDRLTAKLRRPELRRPPDGTWGDLRRAEPVSPLWGSERGTCVDRLYIERFLARHAADIHGVVLECDDAIYTRRYGGERVTRCDVLDVDPGNPRADIVADLCDAPEIPSETYDCLLLTQVLFLIDDAAAALRECRRILRPGGTLLATVPCAARLDPEAPHGDHWRFSESGFRRLLETSFEPHALDMRREGNRAAVMGFLAGLAVEEIEPILLGDEDPDAALVITARATAPEADP